VSHHVVAEFGHLRIERVVTQGVFELDGGSWEVDNNIWIVGDDSDVVVVDAAHDTQPILAALGERNVTAIVCTHGHNDHINVAPVLGYETCAPVLLHADDDMLWSAVHGKSCYWSLHDRQRIGCASTELEVIHTPGHSPGSISLYSSELSAVFTGDTLFNGGPGATGRSFSDFPTILRSITSRLQKLPGATIVYTGHGESTTIAKEIAHADEWVSRGT
jgi:glyoxylase-like metal-dependent hydrolase (beta-lactamase superfamily II)